MNCIMPQRVIYSVDYVKKNFSFVNFSKKIITFATEEEGKLLKRGFFIQHSYQLS